MINSAVTSKPEQGYRRWVSASTLLPIATLVVLLLGSGLRFHKLAGDSFWYDEILTVKTARDGVEGAFNVRGHPPLYYLLVSAATNLLGEHEFTVRLPSALAGVLAIPLILVLGKAIKRPWAGMWAALLLTLSSFHLRYSQEARHYAWLMTLSLASCLFLYLACTRSGWRWWLAFALLTAFNLYTHYAALVVLAWQSAFIGGWLLLKLYRRQYKAVRYPAAAVLVIGVLYLPWIQKVQVALARNLGDAATRGAQDITPVTIWFRAVYTAFGSTVPVLAFLMAALCVGGFLIWTQARDWTALTLFASGILLPFLLIGVFKVSRWAFAKYVIYVLPLYLLAIGVSLSALPGRLANLFGQAKEANLAPVSVLVALALVWVALPQLQAEYERAERDWRGVANHLDQVASEPDTVVSMTLDLPSGFNQGSFVLPYYLEQLSVDNNLLASHSLEVEELQSLESINGNIWAAVLDRVTPVEFTGDGVRVEETFQGDLSLVAVNDPSLSTLDKLVTLYEHIIPLAVTPAPQCLLRQDLALLHVISQDYLAAKNAFEQAQTQCPQQVDGQVAGYNLVGGFYHGLLDQHLQAGETEQARQIAHELLQLDAKDAVALEVVTVVNLLQAFEEGRTQVVDDNAVEPVQVRQYVMPHNGDWGDVLLIHPPASLSYRTTLPAEPTALHFRMAMAPQSWEWGGDGSSFVVLLETDDATPVTLYRQYVSNAPQDRDWHEAAVSLAPYAGQSVTLVLKTEPGPNGDFSGDWAGWEAPRIVYTPGD